MKKSKIILIVSIVVVVLILAIGGTLAALYFTTDIFKSDAELFYKYADQYLGEIMAEIPEPEEITSNYTTKGTVTFDLTSTDQSIANQSIPPRNFSIEYIVNRDNTNNNTATQATLKYINTDLFTVKYAKNGDVYGITSDEVLNKYLTVENKNLKNLAFKLGITDTSLIPDKIELKNIKEAFSVSEQDVNRAGELWMPIIENGFSKDCYSKAKGEGITFNNNTIEANKYTLTATQEQFNKVIVEMLNSIISDEYLSNMYLEDMQLLFGEDYTMQTLKDTYQSIINDIEAADEENANKLIKISVYEKEGTMLRMSIESDVDTSSVINIDNIKENETNKLVIANTIYGEDIKTIKVEIAQTKKDNVKELTLALNADENGTTVYAGSIKKVVTTEANTINKETSIKLNSENETYIDVNINENILITANVDTVIFDATNSASINELSTEYMNQLATGIMTRLGQLFQEKVLLVFQVQAQTSGSEFTGTIPNEPDLFGQNILNQSQEAARQAEEAMQREAESYEQAQAQLNRQIENTLGTM